MSLLFMGNMKFKRNEKQKNNRIANTIVICESELINIDYRKM